MTDMELARRARDGDREAFRQLLEANYDLIFRVAARFTGNAQDAEDIAQDVCLTLADRLRSFRGESRFSTWLYKVALNACRDFARRQKSARALQENYAVFREMDEGDARDAQARSGWLNEAIAALEPSLKETVLLVVGEDMSHGEAARVLGCAETTVSWRMHEARKKLRVFAESDHD
ncbi:MAG: RNA polymerase sigma factor [Hyphomicrobiales bacterium]